MPLDPQAKAIIDQLAQMGVAALHEGTPEEARAVMASFAAMRGPGPDVASVEDRTAPGPAGEIPVRIYRPNSSGTPGAGIVWFHGGGMVLGDLETADATCREMANATGATVVSVDYRLSPEAPYPGPVDDCLAATRHVADNASSHGIDPARIAIGGDSAGGGLAAAVALRARDEGGPTIALQLLVYPMLDRDMGSGSYVANGTDYMLTADSMKWFWSHYLESSPDPDSDYASPTYAKDLSGLPPALVMTAEFDPLRDEGEDYARRLEAAGVDVTCTRYDGQIHGFFGMSGLMDSAERGMTELAAYVSTLAG